MQRTVATWIGAQSAQWEENGMAWARAGAGAGLLGTSADDWSLMKSPIVEVLVGSGENQTTYSAHEAVMLKSPEFAKQVEGFAPGGVRPPSIPQALRRD